MESELIVLLSGLYETAIKARALAQGIIPIEYVQSEGSARVVMASILEEVWKREKLDQLIHRVATDYPEHEQAIAIAQAHFAAAKLLDHTNRGDVASKLSDNQGGVLSPASNKAYEVFLAPPLPPVFVPRETLVSEITSRLTSPKSPGVAHIEVLQGSGGVGKSTLAKALCYSEGIRPHFTGVLWAELGTEANPLEAISRWIAALGEPAFRPTSLLDASDRLRARLGSRRMLLILDDVWNAKDAQPFLVSSQSVVLMTSRRTNAGEELGAHIFEVPSMSHQEAMALLEQWVGRRLRAEENTLARILAESVDYLPLGLELSGSLLSRGMPWDRVCQAFEAETDRLIRNTSQLTRQHARILACIRISVRQLHNEDRLRWEKFAKLAILARGTELTEDLAEVVWEVSRETASAILQALQEDALLQRAGDRWHMHSLVHDVAVQTLTENAPNGVGQSLKSQHEVFLKSCGWSLVTTLNSPFRCDYYIIPRLTWHLEMSNDISSIHALLAITTKQQRCAWFEFLASRNQIATFLSDLNRASRLALTEPSPFSLLYRYSLMRCSFFTLAQCFTSGVLRALVEKGLWDTEQALAIAKQTDSSVRQAEMVISVLEGARIPHPGRIPEGVSKAAIAAVEKMPHGILRAELAARACCASKGETQELFLRLVLDSLTAWQSWPGEWANSVVRVVRTLPSAFHQIAIQHLLERAAPTEHICKIAQVMAGEIPRLPTETDRLWIGLVRSWAIKWLGDGSPVVPHQSGAPVFKASRGTKRGTGGHIGQAKNHPLAANRNVSDPANMSMVIVTQAGDNKKKPLEASASPPGAARSEFGGSKEGPPHLPSSVSPHFNEDLRSKIELVLMTLFWDGVLPAVDVSAFVTSPWYKHELTKPVPSQTNDKIKERLRKVRVLQYPAFQIAHLAVIANQIPESLISRAAVLARSAVMSLWKARDAELDAIDALDSVDALFHAKTRARIIGKLKAFAWQATDDSGWRLARIASVPGELTEAIVLEAEKRFSASQGHLKDRAMEALIKVLEANRVLALLPIYQHIGDEEEVERIRFSVALHIGTDGLLNEIARQGSTHRMRSLAKMMRELAGALTETQLRSFLHAANNLVAEWWVVEALTEVLLKTDRVNAILRILSAGREVIRPDLRSRLAVRAVQRLADRGYLDAALAASSDIEILSERWSGLCDTVEDLSRKGRFRDASRIAEAIDDREERSRAQALMSLHMALLGDVKSSIEVASVITSSKWRVWVQTRLATMQKSLQRAQNLIVKGPSDNSSPLETMEDSKSWFKELTTRSISNPGWEALRAEILNDGTSALPSTFWARVDPKSGRHFFEHFEHSLRHKFLEEMRLLITILAHYHATDHMLAIDRATVDVGQWWQ